MADCRTIVIWHDGQHFYGYGGGLPQPISETRIDSTLIDWTKPHNATYRWGTYRFFCWYDGEPSVLTYHVGLQGWRVRPSDAYDMIGLSPVSVAGAVYGVKADGNAIDLFAADADSGAADSETVREAFTEWLLCAGPEQDVEVTDGVLEVVTEQPVTLDLTFRIHGNTVRTEERTLEVTPAKTRYLVGLNLMCDAISVEARYVGETPPEWICFLGARADDEAAR